LVGRGDLESSTARSYRATAHPDAARKPGASFAAIRTRGSAALTDGEIRELCVDALCRTRPILIVGQRTDQALAEASVHAMTEQVLGGCHRLAGMLLAFD
jgi:hypothetical protein